MAEDSFLIDVSLGSERVTLIAEPDPARQRRALAHGAGFALSHLESELPVGLRAAVLAIAERFARATDGEPLALVKAATSARVALRRRVLAGQRAPAFSPTIRRGRPQPGSLWPFDAESTALELGLRRVIFREAPDPHSLSARGFCVRPVAGGCIAARDATLLDPAAAAIAGSRSANDDWAGHARRAGELLGYPSCCMEAFVRSRRRDDLTLFATSLPVPGAPTAPPECLFLNAALTVVSHVPCTPACEATRTIAAAVLAALEADCPGFRALHSRMARRLHALDREGKAYAFQVDAELAVESALQIDAPVLIERTDIRHLTLDAERGLLLGEGFESSLFARHDPPGE